MSLDHLQLPGFLHQIMFRKNLVEIGPESDYKKNTTINFLGGNERNIVFLVNDYQSKFLDDNDLKFLSGLLTACRLTMADIALVNFFQNNQINYRELTDNLQPKKILVFDISTENLDLPFTVPFFQVQNFQEQVYLLSPSLKELQANKDQKKQLWESLQKIFKL